MKENDRWSGETRNRFSFRVVENDLEKLKSEKIFDIVKILLAVNQIEIHDIMFHFRTCVI